MHAEVFVVKIVRVDLSWLEAMFAVGLLIALIIDVCMEDRTGDLATSDGFCGIMNTNRGKTYQ